MVMVIPKVIMFKAYWRLGPHKYSESFLLTVNRKHSRAWQQWPVLSSNSVQCMMCTSNPYINGKIKTADSQPSQSR